MVLPIGKLSSLVEKKTEVNSVYFTNRAIRSKQSAQQKAEAKSKPTLMTWLTKIFPRLAGARYIFSRALQARGTF